MVAETTDGTRESRDERGPARPGVVAVFSGGAIVSEVIPLGEEPVVLGRERLGQLPDERLSRSHFSLGVSRAGWLIRDLDSRNGTFVDGEAVHGERLVVSPRVLRAADTLFVPVRDVERHRAVVRDGDLVVGGELQRALDGVERAARSSETLVLAGESGTGKELAARRFHERGPNARGPFVAVNCAAIPDGLAERLLFGAKKGAYSGATHDVGGQLGAADGGVLFLDEGGELDLHVQAKLLRAIETQEVLALGATQPARVSFRVCLATHVRLRQAVALGRFRADLYHRLAPPEVVMPPLRDRVEELPHHVVAALATVAPGLAPHVRLVEACALRPWPGNVRELRRHLRDAALQAVAEKADRVRVEHLAPHAGLPFDGPTSEEPRAYVHRAGSLTKEALVRALDAHGGNVSQAARSLGLRRTQLYREMARHGVTRRS